jgi:hypothetical protein
VLQAHRATGGHAYLVTLTLQHQRGDDLAALKRAVADAWRRVIRGAPWVKARAEWGVVGYARALEVTHGAHGWHPHLHVLVCTRHRLAPDDARWLAMRWRAAVIAELAGVRMDRAAELAEHTAVPGAPDVTTQLSEPTERVLWHAPGCRVDATRDGDQAAQYLAKMGLEVAGVGKSGVDAPARGGESQWSLLGRACEGDERATWLWLDYVRAMRGARCLTWSRDLRAEYAVDDEDRVPTGACALLLSARAWSLCREREGEVLDVARVGGAAAVVEWIRARDPAALLGTCLPPPTRVDLPASHPEWGPLRVA